MVDQRITHPEIRVGEGVVAPRDCVQQRPLSQPELVLMIMYLACLGGAIRV